MNILTHQQIDTTLCGAPEQAADGRGRVVMTARKEMAVDDTGLTHGGFIFGLADHAAMIAVNHPNVVLGAASVRFLKPVKTRDDLVAEARVESSDGEKMAVTVQVKRADETVFSGEFTCYILSKHVPAG